MTASNVKRFKQQGYREKTMVRMEQNSAKQPTEQNFRDLLHKKNISKVMFWIESLSEFYFKAITRHNSHIRNFNTTKAGKNKFTNELFCL